MRIMVAHPAQQHSYRLASALYGSKMLGCYCTTVYYKEKSYTKLVASVLKGKFKSKAEGRHCWEIPDSLVMQFCEIEGLIKLLALNTRFLKKQYREIKYHTADRFAKKAARYAIKNNADAVITYDDTSPILFEILKKKKPDTIRILDMSAANILYMRSIYEKDMTLSPAFKKRLLEERKICWDQNTIERTKRELSAAQYFLVPSEFVGRSLEYSGIEKEQIFYCPYGVDLNEFSIKEYENIEKGARPLEFIYVGGVKELKGISYLLDAFKNIPKEKAFLTVVGKYDRNDKDTAPYAEFVRFTGPVLHSEVPALLKRADVFVLPSLGDSFALAAMEAAACGLPIIISENTGIKDLVSDGVNGFVVPIQSTSAIIEKILYFINNPQEIKPMGQRARDMAEKYTWNSYSEKVTEVIEEIIKKHNERLFFSK